MHEKRLRKLLTNFDMTPSQLTMLWLINQSPCRPSDLTKEVVGTKSNVSQRLNAMESEGLITRGKFTSDGRETTVKITPKGKELLKKSKVELSRFELSANLTLYNKLTEAVKRL